MNLPPPPDGKSGWPWTADAMPEYNPAIDWPLISIITPTYEQAGFIEETLRSVLLQGYPNLEYIVYDGGSKDGTVEILERYNEHLGFWVSEPDKGQSDAITKGLNRATGDIINWLNSDDYYQPGTLKTIATAFIQNKATAVGGRGRKFGEGLPDEYGQGTDIHPDPAHTIGWARIDQPETFFSKEAVQAMGPVNQKLHYCMDRDWWLKYLLHFGQSSYVKLEEVVVNFRLHGDSKTVSMQTGFYQERDTIFYQLALRYKQQTLAGHIKTYGQVVELEGYTFDCDAAPEERLIQSALHYFLLQLGMEAYEAGDSGKAGKVFKVVDPNLLDTHMASELKKLKFRNTFVPTGLINMLRRFTR